MGVNIKRSMPIKASPDMVVPIALVTGLLLVFPPLQVQAWWLILPCLICLILRWCSLALLLLFASMTYVDSWWAVTYFLIIITLLFMRLDSRQGTDGWGQLRNTLRQLILTIPLLLIIMVLIVAAGSQWSPRSRTDQSVTGVSDSMTPGAISELVNDTDLAMRVRFDAEHDLQPEDLYWRGLVFEDFDGQTWQRSQRLDFDLDPIPASVKTEDRLHYLVTLEPGRQTWLYGLHEAYPIRSQTYRDHRGLMVTTDVIRQRIRYPVTSIPPQPEYMLSEEQRERNLALPEGGNNQTRLLASRLRQTFVDDQAFIEAVLHHFNQQSFYYTLNPALTGEQGIDDFMFNTRQGFCEHYAGAMTFLLRAAGIPARVVVGYLGGEFNNMTGHWQVAQYNAHAWVEAWVPETGWQRFDPTLAVAPERVMSGLDAWLLSLSREEQQALGRETRLRLFMNAVPGYSAIKEFAEALQYGWNLSMYDSEGELRTEDLATWLERQGLGSLPVWLLVILLLFVGGRVMFAERRKNQTLSPAIQAYLQLNRALKKIGLERKSPETIMGHMQRVASVRNDLAVPCCELGRLLSDSLYGRKEADIKSFKHNIVEIQVAITTRKNSDSNTGKAKE
jgi:transglutaminase-like putative cysteine protease